METHRWTIATLGAIELVLLILAVSLAGCEGGGRSRGDPMGQGVKVPESSQQAVLARVVS